MLHICILNSVNMTFWKSWLLLWMMNTQYGEVISMLNYIVEASPESSFSSVVSYNMHVTSNEVTRTWWASWDQSCAWITRQEHDERRMGRSVDKFWNMQKCQIMVDKSYILVGKFQVSDQNIRDQNHPKDLFCELFTLSYFLSTWLFYIFYPYDHLSDQDSIDWQILPTAIHVCQASKDLLSQGRSIFRNW